MQGSQNGSGASERPETHQYVRPLLGALQGLYRAYQKTSIYPSGHPSVPGSIQQAAREFEEVLAVRPTLVIGVTRDRLLADEVELAESTGTLKALATLLHELDVAAVEFHTGLAVSELETFVHSLGRARREGVKGAEFADEVHRENLPHLQLCPIDYTALRFSEGAEEGRSSDGEGRAIWKEVSLLLTNPRAQVGGDALLRYAEQVTAQINNNEGAGIGSLREELQLVVEKMRGLTAAQREPLRRRLAGFVTALKPGLRQDLLRVDARDARSSLGMITELAEELPIHSIVDALQEVDRVGGRAPGEMITLLNKLVRVSEQRPETSTEVNDTLVKWGLPPNAANLDSTDLTTAMQEVFLRRTEEKYNPKAYQVLLDHLSHEDLDGRMQPSAAKYRDPTQAVEVRAHAAEIAVQCLGRPEGDEQRPGLFAYVGSNADLLLEHGKFTTVHEAVLAARAHTLLDDESDHTRRAATGFLEDFKDRKRIERILQRSFDNETFPLEAFSLLRLGGSEALNCALDSMTSKAPVRLMETAVSLFRDAGQDQLSDVINSRAENGWPILKPLFTVLRELSENESAPALQQLLRNEDAKVRHETLSLLCDLDSRPASRARYLRRALADESLLIVANALKRLAAMDGPESDDLLGDFVEGRIPRQDGQLPAPEHFDRAAGVLVERGQAGCRRLCEALTTLSGSVRPTQARLGRVLAERLEDQSHDPDVVVALKRWRRSPARLMSALLPRIPQGHKEAQA